MEYKIRNENLKNDDLLKDLVEETQNKNFSTEENLVSPIPAAAIDLEDIILEENESQEEDISFSYKDTARYYIQIADLLQQMILPPVYRKTKFTPDERDTLKTLTEAEEVPTEEAEIDLLRRFDEYQDYINSLPLAKHEEKALLGPMVELMKKHQHRPGPENMFFMAAVTIMIPRILPVIKF